MVDVYTVIKSGKKLTQQELNQINQSKFREWNVPPLTPQQKQISLFFLLKDPNDNILAQGQLIPITGVIFHHQEFDIYGIGGIIANQTGQGYGKRLMTVIREFLRKEGKVGIGFTGHNIIGFYQKCGFLADFTSLQRFIHLDGNHKITNTTEDCVFYTESDDNFMNEVFKYPNEQIYLPRDPDW